MKRRHSARSAIVAAVAGGFLTGAATTLAVSRNLPRLLRPAGAVQRSLPEPPSVGRRVDADSAWPDDGARHAASGQTLETAPAPVETVAASGEPTVSADPVPELRGRRLDLPVQGTVRADLRDSFSSRRGLTHEHEAIDIMAPRNTPVVAVEDGTVARLFESKPGGTTIYQFDPSNRYAYYYAHLERYADGLSEGAQVRRGQVLGYVGTTGNAPSAAPHLHFAIFRLTESRQWWKGSPIDPYEVLK